MLKRKLFFNVLILAIVLLSPVAAQGKETLAVLDFTTEAVSETEMFAIVEFLSAELFDTKKYIVIDVSQRDTILKEMEFSMQGCSDDSCALEIGKMLSAEMIVTGNLSKVGSRYLMSVKMLDTETSRTMGTANGKFNDLDELIDGLEPIAYKLADQEEEIAVRPPATEVKAQPIPEAESEQKTTDETGVEKIETPKPGESPAEIARAAAAAKKEEEKKSAGTGGNMGLAIGLTAGGAVAIGTGGYFIYDLLANSLPEYRVARDAYNYAYGDEIEYEALYNASSDAYGGVLLDFIVGSSAVVVGAALTTVGIIMFPSPSDKVVAFSMSPVIYNNPGIVVRVSY